MNRDRESAIEQGEGDLGKRERRVKGRSGSLIGGREEKNQRGQDEKMGADENADTNYPYPRIASRPGVHKNVSVETNES